MINWSSYVFKQTIKNFILLILFLYFMDLKRGFGVGGGMVFWLLKLAGAAFVGWAAPRMWNINKYKYLLSGRLI